MAEKSFNEELNDHLENVLASGGDVVVEYQRSMNIISVIAKLHNRLTIKELSDYKPLIVQACIDSNFSTSDMLVDRIYAIIKS